MRSQEKIGCVAKSASTWDPCRSVERTPHSPELGIGALEVLYVSALLQLVQLVQFSASVSPLFSTTRGCFGSKRPEVRILSPRPT